MTQLSVSTIIQAPKEQVWEYLWDPEHIVHWSFASNDWYCPQAIWNKPQVWEMFSNTFSAKDGSFSFDFTWKYDEVVEYEILKYTLWEMKDYFIDAWRKVEVHLKETASGVEITQIFDTEDENPHDMQIAGWKAILENFKKYVETGEKVLFIKKSVVLNTSQESVFHILTDDTLYRQWTSAFCEGSYYETNKWQVWEKIYFKSPHDWWLISEISYFQPPYQVGFTHLWFLTKDGAEDYESEEVHTWKWYKEIYTCKKVDANTTELTIYQDISENDFESFNALWDAALRNIQDLTKK